VLRVTTRSSPERTIRSSNEGGDEQVLRTVPRMTATKIRNGPAPSARESVNYTGPRAGESVCEAPRSVTTGERASDYVWRLRNFSLVIVGRRPRQPYEKA
jgi:hypothetical protein